MSASEKIASKFKLLFPDSPIAQQFHIGRTKISYIINFGLACHFQNHLSDILQRCDDVTICFDEALNKISQRGQMDIHVRFWHDDTGTVSTRYLNSVFLDHSTASDLLEKCLSGLGSISLEKIFNISVDGPNVNLSFLKNCCLLHYDSEGIEKSIIQTGTCGLHTIHGSIKAGLAAVNWNVFQFLRYLYYLLKDSPCRRADFTAATGCTRFPKKFGATRWLENGDCLRRALEIIDDVKVYLTQNDKKSTKLTNSRVAVQLKKALSNPLLKCYLSFFYSISTECVEFLRRFQSQKPLIPFLYESLIELLTSILKRFVKKEKISRNHAHLLKLDLELKENMLGLQEIDIGFGAKMLLNKVKASEKEILAFYLECQKILRIMAENFLQKSPLKCKIVRALKSLDPNVIYAQPTVGENCFCTVLEELHAANRITELTAEKAKQQYGKLCNAAKSDLAETFKKFKASTKIDDQAVDKFFGAVVGNNGHYEELWCVIKKCLIISHGNATVESGISINKSILMEKENLQEHSLVCQLHSAIVSHGGAEKIPITKPLRLSIRAARQKYMRFLEDQKKQAQEQICRKGEKRKLDQEVKDLEMKKKHFKQLIENKKK